MRKLAKSFVLFLSFAGLLGGATSAWAAACVNVATGIWSAAGTWAAPCNVAGGPVAADTVTIINNTTVTVNNAGMAASSVTINTGANASGLTFAAGSSLVVTNNVVVNLPTAAVIKQINVATGTLTVGGNVTLNGGTAATRDALLTVSSGLITINGGLIINATVATSSTASITAAGGRITVNGAAGVTNGDVVTVGAGTFSVTNAAATFNNTSATNVASTTVSTGTLSVTGNLTNAAAETMTLSSTGNITVGGTLTNNGTVTLTTTGNVNANGDFTNSATGIFTNTAAGILNIGGNATMSGTFNRGTGAVTFNSATPQTLGGTVATTFNNLTINKASNNLTINTTPTVNATLTFTMGQIVTGANAVIVAATGTIATPSASSYVVGNFQKMYAAGANLSYFAGNNFPVGDATNFTPVNITAGTNTAGAAGSLTVSTTATEHPLVTAPIASTGINATYDIARYWTFTTATLTVGTAITATFTFVAGDVDAGANTANFIVERYDGAVWNITTLVAANPLNTQATFTPSTLPVTGSNAFAIGDPVVGFGGIIGAYEAFDTSTPIVVPPNFFGKIMTKVAGTGFTVDIVHVNANKTGILAAGVTVEVRLLDSSSGGPYDVNNCNAAWPLIQALPSFAIPASGRGTILSVTVANSYPNVRFQMRSPVGGPYTAIGCSTDNFAIRPSGFTILVQDLNRTTAGTTNTLNATTVAGVPVHNAGQPFRVQATAVNASAVTTTNYTGIPSSVLSACAGTACPTLLNLGTFSIGTWPAAVAGVNISTTATYSEVGAFTLQLQDTSFASVDTGDGTPASCIGQWVCSSVDVGRFVPDHFAMSGGSLVNRFDFCPLGCGTFTYMGEPMNAVFTLTAMNGAALPATTQNYTYTLLNNLAKLIPTAAVTAYTSGPLGLGVIDTTAPRTPFPVCTAAPAHPCFTPSQATAGSFASGVATGITVPLTVYRGAAAVGPFVALNIGVAPVDSDGVTTVYNLDTTHVVAGANDHTQVGIGEVRYGRINLSNAYGSELLQLPISATVQYWNGTGYVISSTDSATQFNTKLFAAGGNVQPTIAKGPLALANVSVVTPGLVTFANGINTFILVAPTVAGSVDLNIVTAPSYLLPSTTGRATFGVYKGANEFIYLRENY
jgi:hypothetical protein